MTAIKKKDSVVKDPIGMYIMPVYAAGSWIGMLLADGVKEQQYIVLIVASIGAIWALLNTVQNKRLDAGWISMGLVVVATMADLNYLEIAGCVLVSINFMLPFGMWPKIEELVQTKIRSMKWLQVFRVYLLVMAAFWMYSAYVVLKDH